MKNVLFILSALVLQALAGVAVAQSAANFECRSAIVQAGGFPVLETENRTDEGQAYVDTLLDPTGVTLFGAPATSLVHSKGDTSENLTATVIGSYDEVVRAALIADEWISTCDPGYDSCFIGGAGRSRGLRGLLLVIRLSSTRVELVCSLDS